MLSVEMPRGCSSELFEPLWNEAAFISYTKPLTLCGPDSSNLDYLLPYLPLLLLRLRSL